LPGLQDVKGDKINTSTWNFIKASPLSCVKEVKNLEPWIMTGLYCFSDILAIIISILLAYILRCWLPVSLIPHSVLKPDIYIELWPIVVLFIIAYMITGLYPGVGVTAVEELRRITITTSLVFAVLCVWVFFSRVGFIYSRIVFFMAWAFSLLFVPIGRALTRKLFCRKKWWGVSSVIMGAAKTGAEIVKILNNTKTLGISR